ncbi:MAG TPA: hypothetical protein VFT06_16565 [Flavisolibacter sp.]|nr:hypothetical protein [Flavisolibacter sp.]
MKHSSRYTIALILCAAVTLATSCKKGDYLTDGGLHNAQSTLSTYDYLKGHTYHYFDTTILLIDHFNLKDSVNKAGTFFAFTDFSVKRLMDDNGYTSLDDLYANSSSKLVTQYLFGDKNITVDKTSLNAVSAVNWAGVSAPSAVRKLEDQYNIYLTSSAPGFQYFTLAYIKVNGVLDDSPGAPANDPVDVTLPCQTTGILTASGTTLHVLTNAAILNKL